MLELEAGIPFVDSLSSCTCTSIDTHDDGALFLVLNCEIMLFPSVEFSKVLYIYEFH